MAFMYGYYSEDPTYPGGVRLNVEALYMPRQKYENNVINILRDDYLYEADKVAEALGLQRAGWLFTSAFSDVEFLSSEQMI